MMVSLSVPLTYIVADIVLDDDDEVGPEDFEPDGQDTDVCAISDDEKIAYVEIDGSFETCQISITDADYKEGDEPEYCLYGYTEQDQCDDKKCPQFAYTVNGADYHCLGDTSELLDIHPMLADGPLTSHQSSISMTSLMARTSIRLKSFLVLAPRSGKAVKVPLPSSHAIPSRMKLCTLQIYESNACVRGDTRYHATPFYGTHAFRPSHHGC